MDDENKPDRSTLGWTTLYETTFDEIYNHSSGYNYSNKNLILDFYLFFYYTCQAISYQNVIFMLLINIMLDDPAPSFIN